MGKGLFQFKTLTPKAFKPKEIRLALLEENDQAGEELVKLFERTVQTWEGDKPGFELQRKLTGDTVTLEVVLTGSDLAIKKWIWLNRGTSVRYAILSSDWKSKTEPDNLDAGEGSGRVVKIDMDNPQPGIEARNWSKIIMRQFKPGYHRRMQRAMRRGAAKTGHGMK